MSAQTVKCKKCGRENPAAYRFCGACGTPLSTPPPRPAPQPATPPTQPRTTTQTPSTSQGSLTAQDYWEKARQVWKETLADLTGTPEQLEKKRSDLLHVASYCRLAIDHSKGNHPDASAMLAAIMFLLHDFPKARQYAQMTITQEPNNFDARHVLFILACCELDECKPDVNSSSLTGFFVTGGLAVLERANKQGNVKTTARNLTAAFQHNVQSGTKDVEQWIYRAGQLLKAGEVLDDYRMRDPAIYQAIIGAPWHTIALGEHADAVADLCAKARGLMNL